MNNQIICPHCKKSFLPEEGMRHQLDEERVKFRKSEAAKLRKELEEEMVLKLKDKQNETEELKIEKRKLQEELLENSKKERELKKRLEDKDIEMQKKLQLEEEKIRLDARKKAEEEQSLKFLEMQKKMQEQSEALKNMERKLQQGSQQTQGEVLEEFLENTLKSLFVYDEIQPVPKGIRGADVIQIVKNSRGSVAGKIIWESKRTKSWSNDWAAKLKEDKRNVGADEAILITNNLPAGIKSSGKHEGIWVADYDSIIGSATYLRTMLLMVAGAKAGAVDMAQKKDLLFQYVHSVQFRNRVEAITDAFAQRKDEIEVEKRYFNKKWAKEERLISTILSNNASMQGELEAITGIKIDDDVLALDDSTE